MLTFLSCSTTISNKPSINGGDCKKSHGARLIKHRQIGLTVRLSKGSATGGSLFTTQTFGFWIPKTLASKTDTTGTSLLSAEPGHSRHGGTLRSLLIGFLARNLALVTGGTISTPKLTRSNGLKLTGSTLIGRRQQTEQMISRRLQRSQSQSLGTNNSRLMMRCNRLSDTRE